MTMPLNRRTPSLRGGAARAAAAVLATLLSAAPALAQTAPSGSPPARTAAPAAPAAQGESVAAVVNDEVITTYDVRQRLLLLLIQSGVQPTQEQLPGLQREALRTLIDERLQLQELRREETRREIAGQLIATDAQVERAIAQIARQSEMTSEQLQAALAGAGVSIQTLRDRTRAQLSWERWIGGRYGPGVRIGPEQVQTTLNRIRQASSQPQYRINEILIDASRVGGQAEAQRGAQQLIAQIQGGAPFPAVARQFSAAPSAATGGDAGWLLANELPAPVRQAVLQMRPGELSRPIVAPDGVYVVQLRDKRAGAGGTVVNLKQVAVRLGTQPGDAELTAARAKLTALRGRVTGCNGLEAQAARVQGVVAGDLGEAEIGDLAPQFREAAQRLRPGQVSEPIRTPAGLHLVAVCAKRAGGAAAPTPDQVEDRLYAQQLSLVSRRYMRDLRNSATIEAR